MSTLCFNTISHAYYDDDDDDHALDIWVINMLSW